MKKLLLAAILIAGALPAAVSAFAQVVPLGPRFVLPYQTVIDPTGVPIPGALLYFYASGTNTPLNTYADSQLTTPNSNPVAANAAGMFPNIFLSGNYKIVLTDSLNNQIWAADPVLGELSGGGASAITVGSTTVAGGINGDVLYDNAGTLGVLSPTIMINSTSCSLGSTCTIVGSASSITVGVTTMASGTSGYIMYQNGASPSGTVGELSVTGSAGSVVLSSGPTIATLTVTGAFTATGLVTNADLANPAVTVNGTSCTLGSTCSPTASASAITVGVTTIASGVANGLIYDNAGVVGSLAVVNSAVLVTSGSGVPSESTTLPSGLAATNMALTTPTLGVAAATSIAIGGASLGGGAFAVTGASTFNSPVTLGAALTYGGVTLNNAVTGSGNMVLSASPTLSGTVGGSITLSGNNTYSGSALFTGVLASLSGNGQAALGTSSANGAILSGEGSGNDLTFENKSGAVALNVPTGTTNVNVAGTLTFGTLSPTSLGTSPTTITGLTLNNSPITGSDYVAYYSSANGAINKISVAALTSSGVAGVSSLNGLTGGLSIVGGTGITVSALGSSVTVNNSGVTSVATGNGLSGGTITTTGTLTAHVDAATINDSSGPLVVSNTTIAGQTCTPGSTCGLSSLTAALGSNTSTGAANTYTIAAQVAQGTSGTWFASGHATVNSSTSDTFVCKLWDGTTTIASGGAQVIASSVTTIAISGVLANPAANIRLSCADLNTSSGSMLSTVGSQADSSIITVFRIN